jgi:hypothetical protein
VVIGIVIIISISIIIGIVGTRKKTESEKPNPVLSPSANDTWILSILLTLINLIMVRCMPTARPVLASMETAMYPSLRV